MDSAAWAPIASETVPIRTVATAIERRDKQSCVKFITGAFLLDGARKAQVAPNWSCLLGMPGGVPFNYAVFAALQ
jgi:hypothetical protein